MFVGVYNNVCYAIIIAYHGVLFLFSNLFWLLCVGASIILFVMPEMVRWRRTRGVLSLSVGPPR